MLKPIKSKSKTLPEAQRTHLHCLQIWPLDDATSIATLPIIPLLALSAGIELVSLSARVTSIKSQQCSKISLAKLLQNFVQSMMLEFAELFVG